ncbi:Oidioi.mRNA.OKI2018_I69.chr2.g5863.t1.cds [Oikopleura dioica]|uniref:Oidioi.mRNA.OKI2018_I69.chr2.g5863.t1.cds n=1 Tax=Oikopleura dioica TaxID=34765 RepID=A0ABN7T570_OIKDI|nr:Oidioi.mRNA.OKI2018_I69.chr2.g5863.t1.cds [Oikopleura dioica]
MAALAAPGPHMTHGHHFQAYPSVSMGPIWGFKAPSPMSSTSASGNASPTHDVHGQQEKLSETNLYIRGLSAETKDEDLHTMCERFGKIVSTKAIVDNENGKCKGYGFVDFEDPENARVAKETLAEDGIQIQFAKKQEEDPTNIYFSNLPEWISDKSLRDMLEPYGEVISTRILRHPGSPGSTEGRSKGVGFARMHGKEQCEKVIGKFNGHPLTDPKNPTKPSGKPLLVKFADGGQKKKKNHQLNITTTFRRDEMPMAMEHFLPGFALPAGMPMHAPYLNMPVGPYQYPHNAFPAPFQLPVPGDVLPQGYPMGYAMHNPYQPMDMSPPMDTSVDTTNSSMDDSVQSVVPQQATLQPPVMSVPSSIPPIYYQQVA